jgi:hypothetical protein
MDFPRNPPIIRQKLPPKVKILSESVDYLDKEWIGKKITHNYLHTKAVKGFHNSPLTCKKRR